MTSLAVEFAGLKLRNPVIVASCPATETAASIKQCADAGAAAVVTKTVADYDAGSLPLGARRTHSDASGLWAMSTFRRETLDLAHGCRLVEEAVRQVDIPVIASAGAVGMAPKRWLATCRALQDAGASLIHLDLFYLPQPRASQDNLLRLEELLKTLTEELTIGVAPKLNIDLPAYLAADLLSRAKPPAVFAMDSIRVPAPVSIDTPGGVVFRGVRNPSEASLFGPWQRPITLQYVRVLSELVPEIQVCAGGGFINGRDALEAIFLGATTVQFATLVLKEGYRAIGRVLTTIESQLARLGVTSITEVRGAAFKARAEAELVFDDLVASVDMARCTACGKCVEQTFCSSISRADGRVAIDASRCDGCGFCVSICPTRPASIALDERRHVLA